MSVRNRTIVITGASSGIGEAAAKELARRGARVCLLARRAEELERVRASIEREGGAAFVYPVDLSDEASIDRCADALLAEHPAIDVLVNNAGRSIRRPIRESLDRLHDYRRTMQLNYFGAVQLTLRLLPRFLAQRSGHVVNSSSMSMQLPTPRFSAYLASKAALDAFSRSLDAELAHEGIAVTTLYFPLVRTPMSTRTSAYLRFRMMDPTTAAEWVVDAIENRPSRIGRPLGTLGSVVMAAMPGATMRWTRPLFRALERRIRKNVRARESERAEGEPS